MLWGFGHPVPKTRAFSPSPERISPLTALLLEGFGVGRLARACPCFWGGREQPVGRARPPHPVSPGDRVGTAGTGWLRCPRGASRPEEVAVFVTAPAGAQNKTDRRKKCTKPLKPFFAPFEVKNC